MKECKNWASDEKRNKMKEKSQNEKEMMKGKQRWEGNKKYTRSKHESICLPKWN
jgi:hypothetical protein